MNKKKIVIVVVSVVFCLLLLSLFAGNQSIIEIYKGYKLSKQLDLQIQTAYKTIDSLKTEIYKLEHDTAYIERIARERLGMAKKNELVYKFVEKKK